MTPDTMDDRTVKSINTMFRIIESLRDRERATLAEVATDAEVAKSTAHRHLSTLKQHEYVTTDGDQYRVGLKFLDVGGHVRSSNSIYQVVKPKVRQIAEEVGEINQFMVEEHGKGVVVYREKGENAVRTESRVGKRFLLHQTAGGKAILSHFSDGRIEQIIDKYDLTAQTENTITNRDELHDELESIREEGVAFDNEEHIQGLRAVAAPIKLPNGQICGSLGVAGPTNRMKGKRFREEVPEILLGIINEIELNIEYSDI